MNSTRQYAEYLRGKRVVLVGPAATLCGDHQGAFINDFDAVVRLNRGSRITEDAYADQGNRTDILYHSGFQGQDSHKVLQEDLAGSIQWLVGALPQYGIWSVQIKNMGNVARRSKTVSFRSIEHRVYLQGQREINCRLNCGTAAVLDLLQFPLKALHIVGITMYRPSEDDKAYATGLGYEERSTSDIRGDIQRVGVHKMAPQMRYLRHLAEQHKHVTLGDDVVGAIQYWGWQ